MGGSGGDSAGLWRTVPCWGNSDQVAAAVPSSPETLHLCAWVSVTAHRPGIPKARDLEGSEGHHLSKSRVPSARPLGQPHGLYGHPSNGAHSTEAAPSPGSAHRCNIMLTSDPSVSLAYTQHARGLFPMGPFPQSFKIRKPSESERTPDLVGITAGLSSPF